MRVLVVEDEAKMAEILRRGVREEGHAVDLATTGGDGLWLGLENPYDAVVLDLMLPDLDGFEVCRRLRAQDRWASLRSRCQSARSTCSCCTGRPRRSTWHGSTCWAGRLVDNAAANDAAAVNGDLFTLEYIRDRILDGAPKADVAAVNTGLGDVLTGVLDGDLAAAAQAG